MSNTVVLEVGIEQRRNKKVKKKVKAYLHIYIYFVYNRCMEIVLYNTFRSFLFIPGKVTSYCTYYD